jgi:hypothetical protein
MRYGFRFLGVAARFRFQHLPNGRGVKSALGAFPALRLIKRSNL